MVISVQVTKPVFLTGAVGFDNSGLFFFSRSNVAHPACPLFAPASKSQTKKNSAPRKNREAELVVSDLIPKEVNRSSGKEED